MTCRCAEAYCGFEPGVLMNFELLRRAAALAWICAMLTFSAGAAAESQASSVPNPNVGGTPARHPGDRLSPPSQAPAQPYEAPAPRPATAAPPVQPASPARVIAAPSSADNLVQQSLDEAIEHEKSRRRWSVAGLVAGGVVVIGGFVYASVDAQRNANRTHKDQWAVNWIGLGVGLPILGVSAYNLIGATKELNRLRRARVGIVPRADGVEVGFALDF